MVIRDRTLTQGWASRIHRTARFAGVRWWSYYDPRWGSIGLWELSGLTVRSVEVLDDLDQPAVVEAAEVLNRVRRR
ncbi:MAG TPA: hypothetical protein VFD94_08365 [Jatrophihabitans sp.]|nr:hypothetical protein [Jatrophihabitans sp.]